MPLPSIPSDPNGRYTPTSEFVEGMIEGFKKGGKLPKRVVWEIILGCKELLDKEKSLVEVTVPEGVTCDIVGDSKSCSMWEIYVRETMLMMPAHGVSGIVSPQICILIGISNSTTFATCSLS
jgi:hypothetical protein